MAILEVANGAVEPRPLIVDLRSALPDEYAIVWGPTIGRHVIDAVVISARAVVVLHIRDWTGTLKPARLGPWVGTFPTGQKVRYRNPAGDAARTRRAVRGYLRDEAPGLQVPIRSLIVLATPDAHLDPAMQSTPPVASAANLAQAVVAASHGRSAPLSETRRAALVATLSTQQLSASQRTKRPLVFPSGGFLGRDKRVHSVHAAIRHMDSHPRAGMALLADGRLENWLADEGAGALSERAREARQAGDIDPQIPLERFLLGSGLVRRPRLRVSPANLRMGRMLAGDGRVRLLEVYRPGKRGYLFGRLEPTAEWLRVEPASLSDGGVDAAVMADSSGLEAGRNYWASVRVQPGVPEGASAAAERVIPVTMRVVPEPSQASRTLGRPLAGLVLTGILGGLLGWAFASWGARTADTLASVSVGTLTPALTWALLIGTLWAFLGLLRGYNQRASWPTLYATGRWLLRTVEWGIGLVLLATLIRWAWLGANVNLWFVGSAPSQVSEVAAKLGLASLALGAILATMDEVRQAHAAEPDEEALRRRTSGRRWLELGLGAVVLVVVLGGAFLLRPAYDRLGEKATPPYATRAAGDWLRRTQTSLEDWVDKVTLQYYDRRAPARATPEPEMIPAKAP
ncbi:MAG: nuclease-related domain-containing protein [Anaerolineae bacterium]